MRKFLYVICLLFYTIGYSQSKQDIELIQSVVDKYKKAQSISYDIEYMMKFFDDDEPFYVNSSVFIERNKKDSIFKGNFIYQRKDTFMDVTKYYDSEFLYTINHNEEIITKFNAKNEEIFPITGNVDGNVLNTYFLEVEKLESSILNSKLQKEYSDSLSYLKVKFSYPDDEDIYGQEKTVYFNKVSNLIEEITFVAKYKDQIQKNKWVLSNIAFDKVEPSYFVENTKEYFKNYKVQNYQAPSEDYYNLLENGKLLPQIKGKIYPDYSKELVLESDKILILDFWYTSCMPCIKVIPVLNQLQQKYSDYIQVIGVNPVENEEKHQKKIEAFLNRTPINYPILLVKEIPDELNIKAYPTLYLIGKDGKVKFSKIGSQDDLFGVLENELEKLIDKK